jgi:hypothetical protein
MLYNAQKVSELLNKYISYIKDEVSYDMWIGGGGDCPYVWIEVAVSKTDGQVTDSDVVCFFIADEDDDGGKNTGKFYFQRQKMELDGCPMVTEFLENRKTKKAVKEFMLRVIKREAKEMQNEHCSSDLS